MKIGNYEIVGSLETITKVIKDKKISHVIFSSEDISFEKMFSIVSKSDVNDVEFLVAGNELDYLVGKTSVTMLENIPLLKVHYNITEAGHKIIKNIFDIVISLPILILIYPFVLVGKLFKNISSDFGVFILKVPSVLILKRSLVGPKVLSQDKNLYLGKEGLTGLWYVENYVKLD